MGSTIHTSNQGCKPQPICNQNNLKVLFQRREQNTTDVTLLFKTLLWFRDLAYPRQNQCTKQKAETCLCKRNPILWQDPNYLPHTHTNSLNLWKGITWPNDKLQTCNPNAQTIQSMPTRTWIHPYELPIQSIYITTSFSLRMNWELLLVKVASMQWGT